MVFKRLPLRKILNLSECKNNLFFSGHYVANKDKSLLRTELVNTSKKYVLNANGPLFFA